MPLPDLDAISTYNGATNGVTQDYHPVEDPQTDIPADGMNALMATVAMSSRTLTRGYCTFRYASGASALVVEHDAVWGNSVSVIPTVDRAGAGLFKISLPATVTDAIGGTHSVNVRRAWGQVEVGGTSLWVFCARSSANSINVLITNSASAATDPTGLDVDVWYV